MSGRDWLRLILLSVLWGGSFFFAEIALTEVPPLTITLHRVFWALPVLAIAGLKAKDIMGFCLVQLVITGIIISVVLTLL